MALRRVNESFLFQGKDMTTLIAALQPLFQEHGYTINRLIEISPEIVASANLPAAGAANNGRVIVEDGGAGNGNLVIYVGNQRFRLDGGSPF